MKKVLVSLAAYVVVFAPSIDASSLLPTARAQSIRPTEQVLQNFDTQNDLPDPNIIFSLVNQERGKSGAEALRPSPLLTNIAKKRAADMQHNDYYAHQSPDGSFYYDSLVGSQYSNVYSCENLDLRFDKTNKGFVADWLGSTPHKKCLLNPDVARAGYAVVELKQDSSGQGISSYIVVAIHAAE